MDAPILIWKHTNMSIRLSHLKGLHTHHKVLLFQL